ncbi:hypothetical protein HUT19_33505 [Streptomyces sp. NA02950]|uniref:hypothetical protein n=1 Tax=Streptomyces sp. NA02950 TaxID=2742137 RepID=UPI0015922D4A|nr:hypothetical protein [Streptomyces sp. NA02950]QKV96041.1 hypothetical protein HUT19_33505 [Streptomyces sp. NA02950]
MPDVSALVRRLSHRQHQYHCLSPECPSSAAGVVGTAGVMVTLHRSATGPLLRALRSSQMPPPMLYPWGSRHVYESLLETPRPAILDVPRSRSPDCLEERIRVLGRLAPVIALVPAGVDASRLLDAGAANVLRRDMPVRELAARLLADQRWFAAVGAPAPRRQSVLPPSAHSGRGTGWLLLNLLLSSERPWFWHELCLLLGTGDQPLDRRALRARVERLRWYAARYGVSVRVDVRWGLTSFTAEPSIPSAPCLLRTDRS